MTLDEYQREARKTSVYPDIGKNFTYPTLGLVGEAGEVAEKVKKILRDDDGKLSEEKREELIKEMGDVLWYLANLGEEVKVGLSEVAERNLEKLASREKRGRLKGSGDNR